VFEWDEGNLDHVARHGVSPEEAEEAVLDRRRVSVTPRTGSGERRWAIVGATGDGRRLWVRFTRRAGQWRVVIARDASPTERRRYRR